MRVETPAGLSCGDAAGKRQDGGLQARSGRTAPRNEAVLILILFLLLVVVLLYFS